ncbi:hypothetical protein [Stappia sp.]|uniref:hypothetical protein n=1 Tax=Stappia sp. TaxID=1870903 RepID=UPI0032D94B49
MIRFVVRLLGLWLLAVALVMLVVDGTKTIAAAQWMATPLGQLWFDFAPESLNTAQAAIQRHVAPVLWDPVIQTVLTWPAWAVAGPLGFLLMWLGERRRARRRLHPA